MKFLKIKLPLTVVFLLSSSLAVCSNVFILNKVKPEEGGAIYVQVSYFSYFSTIIPLRKSQELWYNESLELVGVDRIRWIRIRNIKDEWEEFKMPGEEPAIMRKIKSRIASITGDERIGKACNDYLNANPELKKKRKDPTYYCHTGKFRKMGARLKNRVIEIGHFLPQLSPIALAVTRKSGTGDFIVTEIAAGTELLSPFGRGNFYHYVQGKDLDTYKQKGAQK